MGGRVYFEHPLSYGLFKKKNILEYTFETLDVRRNGNII